MWGMADDPILTWAQVLTWQARQREIGGAIRTLQDEAEGISRKLDAVRVILGDLPSYPGAVTDSDHPFPGQNDRPSSEPAVDEVLDRLQSETFSEAVAIAVGRIGGAPRPNEIRTWLREHGATEAMRAQADKPYFYSVLMRHATSGRLIKEGEGYRLRTRSPEGDTGGVAPPDDSLS
jgi:hypothetical protein